jgi:uncharacterized membrane protein
MMQERPVSVLVGAFQTENGASDALHELEGAKRSGLIDIKDAAVLRRDEKDKLRISETADKGFGRGAVLGGVAGAVVGVIAGPIGWATLSGAAVGGLAARLRDGGFRDDRLRTIGEWLPANSSAIVAVIDEKWVDEVEHRMQEWGANVVTEAIAAEVADKLDQESKSMEGTSQSTEATSQDH